MDTSPYRRAQLEARAISGAMVDGTATVVAKAMRDITGRLAKQLASLPTGTPAAQREALRMSRVIIDRSYRDLEREILRSVAGDRRLAFERVLGAWQEAGDKMALRAGLLPPHIRGRVGTGNGSLVGSYETLGSGARTWRNALREYTRAAAREANTIASAAIRDGIPPREIARRLRQYMQGTKDFQQAFSGPAFEKVRRAQQRLPKEVRGSARRMRFNARRIAESEVANARAEAELQHYASDPLIDGILWRTAKNRGKARIPDICDVLAAALLYAGKPAGWYPLDQVPLPPHPFDRCERIPYRRPISDAMNPKSTQKRLPKPRRVNLPGVSRRRSRKLREELAGLLDATERSAAGRDMRRLLRESRAEAKRLVRVHN